MSSEYAKAVKGMLTLVVPFTGYAIGKYLDDLETERMTRFRDKSSLYKREASDTNDKPSWPSWQAS